MLFPAPITPGRQNLRSGPNVGHRIVAVGSERLAAQQPGQDLPAATPWAVFVYGLQRKIRTRWQVSARPT